MEEMAVGLASDCIGRKGNYLVMGQGRVLLALMVEVAMWSHDTWCVSLE